MDLYAHRRRPKKPITTGNNTRQLITSVTESNTHQAYPTVSTISSIPVATSSALGSHDFAPHSSRYSAIQNQGNGTVPKSYSQNKENVLFMSSKLPVSSTTATLVSVNAETLNAQDNRRELVSDLKKCDTAARRQSPSAHASSSPRRNRHEDRFNQLLEATFGTSDPNPAVSVAATGSKGPKKKDKRNEEKVQDWMTTQMTNLSVSAPVFEPTGTTFIKRNKQVAEIVEPPLANTTNNELDVTEDERTLLCIFPQQNLDNVRNVLIAHNGSVDMAIETLCDVSDQQEEQPMDAINTDDACSDHQVAGPSSSSATGPITAMIKRAIPTLKELALKVIDASLTASSLGADAMVMINSSISVQDRSNRNLTILPKSEPAEDANPIIDLLESDSEDSEDENQDTVIENIMSSTVLPSGRDAMLSESTIVDPFSKEVKFKLELGKTTGLKNALTSLFGDFPGSNERKSIQLSENELKVIYDAWKRSPIESQNTPRLTDELSLFPSIVNSLHDDSVVEVLKISPSPDKSREAKKATAMASVPVTANDLPLPPSLVEISSTVSSYHVQNLKL